MGPRDYRGPADRRGVGGRARRDPGAPGWLFRNRPLRSNHPRPGAALPRAAPAEIVGRLLRCARNGSDRSVHRLGRYARHHHRSHSARAAAPSGDLPGVRAIRLAEHGAAIGRAPA